MSTEHATSALQFIGGPPALIGTVVGAYLNAQTSCKPSLLGPEVCSNWAGPVSADFLGQATAELALWGGLGGALIGAAAYWGYRGYQHLASPDRS